jgi:hypothetical protein
MFVPGTRCPLCGQGIQSASDAVMFSPFVSNQADPLFVFNDATVLAGCFRKHPLGETAQARYEELRERTNPTNRSCFVCGSQITNPDDYLAFGHLVDDPKHPLHSFNYAQFHRSCLGHWSALADVLRYLEALDQSGTWKGDALKRLIKELRVAQPKP